MRRDEGGDGGSTSGTTAGAAAGAIVRSMPQPLLAAPAGTGPVSAADQAAAAAQRVGVELRELVGVEEFAALSALFDEIWRQPGTMILPANLVRAVSHAGGYVAGAFDGDGDGDLVGGSFGFLGRHGEELVLHSHITGARPGRQGAGVGFALKQHQRAWSLAHGIATVVWTFDPLVSRNAYFNLRKLGALATGYGADFYGEMPDAINAGDHSDRLVVRWDLASARAAQAADGGLPPFATAGTVVVLDADDAGRPRVREDCVPDGPAVLRCRVPMDVLALRRHDPAAALAWRLAVRTVLGGALGAGYRAVDATPDGWYVLAPGRTGDAA